MMTKRHFVALAAAFKAARADVISKEPDASHTDLLDGISYAAEHVADACANDNPQFNRARFLAACGVDG